MLDLIEAQDFEGLRFFILVRIAVILGCWFFVIISCIVDFWSGTSTAKIMGQPLMSHGFRRTVIKIGDYIKLMFFALMFDILGSLLTFYVAPFASILCTISVLVIEGKSVLENSRMKKTHAADVPEMVKQIVQAVTAEQGAEVLNKIVENLSTEKKELKNKKANNA